MRGFQKPPYLIKSNLLDGSAYRHAFELLVPEVRKVSRTPQMGGHIGRGDAQCHVLLDELLSAIDKQGAGFRRTRGFTLNDPEGLHVH